MTLLLILKSYLYLFLKISVEWLVIDECDKLFESGFRDQLSVIFNSCSESSKLRHAMFSATYDVQLEKWAKMNLDNVVTVIIGGKNKAAEVVDQKLTFVGNEQVFQSILK